MPRGRISSQTSKDRKATQSKGGPRFAIEREDEVEKVEDCLYRWIEYAESRAPAAFRDRLFDFAGTPETPGRIALQAATRIGADPDFILYAVMRILGVAKRFPPEGQPFAWWRESADLLGRASIRAGELANLKTDLAYEANAAPLAHTPEYTVGDAELLAERLLDLSKLCARYATDRKLIEKKLVGSDQRSIENRRGAIKDFAKTQFLLTIVKHVTEKSRRPNWPVVALLVNAATGSSYTESQIAERWRLNRRHLDELAYLQFERVEVVNFVEAMDLPPGANPWEKNLHFLFSQFATATSPDFAGRVDPENAPREPRTRPIHLHPVKHPLRPDKNNPKP